MGSEAVVCLDRSRYVTFKRLFNPVIERLHHPFICDPAHLGDRHISNLNPERLLLTPIDPKGRYSLLCVISHPCSEEESFSTCSINFDWYFKYVPMSAHLHAWMKARVISIGAGT
eukprot:COSAG05_NODE_1697_length_4258_cov_7.337822_2_plen_115_part_00